MKKYLMTGIAALAMCFGFTSCSHDIEPASQEDLNNLEAEQIVNAYNQAFIKTFGQPAANQTWGFGTSYTRALSDMTPGASKNRNQWAATDGNFKLLVPTPLTKGQKDRVQAYFQAHKGLTWEAPTMTNYFIQQVYKGNPQTAGALSAEQYSTGNGKTVKSSDHMNQLTVGANNVHVLDFNKGDNPNNAKDVKDNGTLTNDNAYHSDQITLIIGVQPTCVGFHVTEGNVQHNDCMALAGAKAIDDWARAQTTVIGEDVWYGKDKDGYDNSSWNRSFVGLDYEQIKLEDCYAHIPWNDPNPAYVTVNETQRSYFYLGKDANNKNIIKSKAQYLQDYPDGYLRDLNGNKIHWITSNTNEICGDNIDFPNQDSYMPRMDCTSAGGGNNDQVLDMVAIQGKIDQNAYPAATDLMKWVKNIGGRDYVYSDWIVTLTPAQELTQSNDYDVRIIAEDLNATAQDGDLENSDWDFNDVVFDVNFTSDDAAVITLVAAGGTLPLVVGIVPEDGVDSYPYNEVHALFGVPVNYMVNTNAEKKNLTGGAPAVGHEAPTINFTKPGVKASNGKDIPIYVQKTLKNGTKKWFQLTAEKGQPASKLAVNSKSSNFSYCDERQDITKKYTNFLSWVVNNDPLIWWEN
jgi:hypothetical protein